MASMKPFILIKFLTEVQPVTQLPLVDLVTRRWLTSSIINANGQQVWYCAYPPPPYTNMINMVKRHEGRGLTWNDYQVEVLESTDTYEKGKTLLRRAIQKLSLSSDTDQSSSESDHEVVDLDKVPQFPAKTGNKSDPRIDSTNQAHTDHTPADSGRKSADSGSKAADSSRKSADSGSRSADHGRKSADSGSKSTDPGRKSADSGNKSIDSGRKSADSGRKSADLDSGSADSGRKSADLDSESADSGQKSADLDSESADLVRKSADLGSESAEDVIESERTNEDAAEEPDNSEIDKDKGLKRKLDRIFSCLQEMEKRITEEIKRTKRSVNHDVTKLKSQISVVQSSLDGRLNSNLNASTSSASKIQDFEDVYCGDLPFRELEDFKSFDTSLGDKDISVKFVGVLESLWVPIGKSKSQTLSKSVLLILERYFSRNVAIKYSAQGKGKFKKLNFSATRFYRALGGVIILEPDVDVKQIYAAVGKCLANASDWDGGRAERKSKAQLDGAANKETIEEDAGIPEKSAQDKED